LGINRMMILQALKIWIKGVPFIGHAHENKTNLDNKSE